jgi:RNA polymerase sigma factor (TIGR02999 family)
VHEVYLRLFSGESPRLQDRAHFFAIVARHLRHIIIDHARSRRAEKRGGVKARLTEIDVPMVRDEDLVELDLELTKLEELDSRSAQVVELRFFGGLRESEISEALDISVATVKRDWEFARAWLMKQLNPK